MSGIVIVTGGRDYSDYAHVESVLDDEAPDLVVQGECPYGGADRLAKLWCRAHGVPCFGMEAHFAFYGRSAGPKRNGWMLDFAPKPIKKLIAFPGDRGTADCIKRAGERGILVRDERAGRSYP